MESLQLGPHFQAEPPHTYTMATDSSNSFLNIHPESLPEWRQLPLQIYEHKIPPTYPLPPNVIVTDWQHREKTNDRRREVHVRIHFLAVLLAVSNVSSPHLALQIERWGPRDACFSYNIVAAFGSQPTGRSG